MAGSCRLAHGRDQWRNFSDHDVYNVNIINLLPRKGPLTTSRWAPAAIREQALATFDATKARAEHQALVTEFIVFISSYASKYQDFNIKSSSTISTSPTPSLDPIATTFNLRTKSNATPTISANTDTPDMKGLQGSRWASPTPNSTASTPSSMLVAQSASTRNQNASLLSTVTSTSLLPHLRKAETSHTGTPIKTAEVEYVLPHLRIAVDQVHTPARSAGHSMTSTENNQFSSIATVPLIAKRSAINEAAQPHIPTLNTTAFVQGDYKSTTPSPCNGRLVESWDDFVAHPSPLKFNPNNYGNPLARQPNSATVSAPVDSATTFNNASVKPEFKKVQPTAGSGAKSSTSGEATRYSIAKMLEIGLNSNLKEPKHIHTAIIHDVSAIAGLESISDKSKNSSNKGVVPLSRHPLTSKTGAAPPKSPKAGLEHNASKAGIEDGTEIPLLENRMPDNKVIQDSRAEIAPEAIGLRDWDGSWAPAPASWETERNGFSNEFIPSYINIWNLGFGDFHAVDLEDERFLSGERPINTLNGALIEAPDAPMCFPNQTSENLEKQRVQTAEMDCKCLIRNKARLERRKVRNEVGLRTQTYAIMSATSQVNPNTPLVPVYLRPATEKDIPSITALYNHYVQNSIVTEDQTPVVEATMLAKFMESRKEYLPFIVAVKGASPNPLQLVSNEMIVGFSHAEGYFGMNSKVRGLRRFTSTIKFYVEPNHLRKGIGRALLDRLLQSSCSSHVAKDGYNWVVSKEDSTIYNNVGFMGDRRYHQILIEMPVELKDKIKLPWFKQWLESKFYFKQVALLESVGRSTTIAASARFLDVAVFQLQAAHPSEFDHFV